MSVTFNADEIFAVAERIEINGEHFYHKAAGFTSHAPTKVILEELAAMEEVHRKTFAAMRAHLGDKDRKPAAWDPEGDAALYLTALADGRVFDVSDPSRRITGQESMTEILRIAIGLEKDSIAFYAGMLAVVPQELGKFHVADIIKEEMRHVTILTKHLSQFEK